MMAKNQRSVDHYNFAPLTKVVDPFAYLTDISVPRY